MCRGCIKGKRKKEKGKNEKEMATSLSTIFFRILAKYQLVLLRFGVFAFFLTCSVLSYYWLYLPYMKKRNQDNVEISSTKDRETEVGPTGQPDHVLYLFHVDWCKYCVTALPKWQKFVSQNVDHQFNGKRVSFVDVNLTDDSSEDGVNKSLRQKYNVGQFPEVHLVIKNKKPILFDAAITEDTLTRFLKDSV
jgi:thiol-disulfide isomerase/thioredoxin